MKARILPFESDEHQAVHKLLPWHVNDTLDAAETARVLAHLAECPRCRDDVAWQARLRSQDPVDARDDAAVERGWASMRQRLQPAQPAPETAAPAQRPRAAGPMTRWLQLAVGLEAALVVVLAVAWFGAAPRDESFRALGSALPAPAGANALVVFRPEASEAEIRSALRASGARLVGGPTVTDAYLLRLASPSPEMLSRLRAERAVARVESLEAQVPP